MSAPIKAIIWDLDGTLIHFKINFLKARRAAIKILQKNGVPKSSLTVKQSILDNVAQARLHFKERGELKEKLINIIEDVDNAVIAIEADAAKKATKIDGIDQVLEWAREKGLKQAIYTFNTRDNAVLSLKTAGLAQYLEFIAGRDNVKRPKPHPDHLNYVCNHLNIECSEIVVVGDTARDIEGAKNVGARSIAINTKISNYIKQEAFKTADFMIEEKDIPDGLIGVLKTML